MNREMRIGLAASALLHGAAILVLLTITPLPAPPPGEQVVRVTIASPPAASKPVEQPEQAPPPPPLAAQQAPQDVPTTAAPPTPPAEQEPSVPQPPKENEQTVVARDFYAEAILARPQNRQAREALATLSPAERREQICDTEAMEQLHRWRPALRPDRLIAYALQDTTIKGNTLSAPGAAFRSAHQWYALTFECSLDASDHVVGFRFAMGAPIPEDRWNDLLLER